MIRRRAILGLLSLTVLLLGGCGESGPTPEETTLTKVGQQAPDFEATTLDGHTFSLSAERGKVVLLDFFATWCPPCREEMPHLEKEVWQRFRNHPFAMLALGREQDATDLQPFVQELGLTFPVAADPGRGAFGLYAEQYIPRTVVVGSTGTILFQTSGYEPTDFERMVAVIATAVREAETSHPQGSPTPADQSASAIP